MKETRFTLIIPVYNAAKYLRACLDSVCDAAKVLERAVGGGERTISSPVEVICVDDGSTDESGVILDEYASRQFNDLQSNNPTILRVIHQKNAGVSAARNAALEIATGDYVCFLDPDDVVALGWFANFRNAIDKTKCDLAFAEYRPFYEGERPKLDERPIGAIVEHGEGPEVRKTLLKRFLVDGRCFMFALRRELLKGVRFVEGVRLAEDQLLCLRLTARVRSYVRTDYVGHGYRQHAQSLTAVGLRSRERVAFLKAFAELRTEAEGVSTSLAVWQMVQFWLVNAADTEAAVEIRDELRHLQSLGMFRIAELPRLSRPGAALFMRWPSRPRMVRFVHCAVYKIGRLLGLE